VDRWPALASFMERVAARASTITALQTELQAKKAA
jgi:hypothetical protein